MRVPGKIFADKSLIKDIHHDQAIQQIVNVAHLPGIVGESLAMPNIHWGYGFAIGGVAAMDIENGVISPSGVGYDIDCGVRLLRTALTKDEVLWNIKELVGTLYNTVPTGVGSSSSLNLSINDLKKLLAKGAELAVEKGFGTESDIDRIEENGRLRSADVSTISERALKRGRKQVGTLGSGNHFLEIGYVEEIYDEKTAETLGLYLDGITVIIHTGPRGFGYQVCDDYLKVMMHCIKKYDIELPDRQLACTPINFDEGKNYFAEMSAAANYAWANRQKYRKIRRVCNKWKKRKVYVHRKGATRALPPGHKYTPSFYKSVG